MLFAQFIDMNLKDLIVVHMSLLYKMILKLRYSGLQNQNIGEIYHTASLQNADFEETNNNGVEGACVWKTI